MGGGGGGSIKRVKGGYVCIVCKLYVHFVSHHPLTVGCDSISYVD